MRAFAAAQLVADTHPLTGSAEWWRWRFLCDKAIRLNDSYILKVVGAMPVATTSGTTSNNLS